MGGGWGGLHWNPSSLFVSWSISAPIWALSLRLSGARRSGWFSGHFQFSVWDQSELLLSDGQELKGSERRSSCFCFFFVEEWDDIVVVLMCVCRTLWRWWWRTWGSAQWNHVRTSRGGSASRSCLPPSKRHTHENNDEPRTRNFYFKTNHRIKILSK